MKQLIAAAICAMFALSTAYAQDKADVKAEAKKADTKKADTKSDKAAPAPAPAKDAKAAK
jgi:hypothetical protein